MSARGALVFSGSRRIDAAIALRLARNGFDVALTYVSQPGQVGDIVSAIENVGRHAVAIKADSADPSAIRTAVAEVVQQLGTLDVAAVNAGVLRLVASVETFTLEETEVARLCAYLARPEAAFVTGSAVTINGGCLA
jgi:3-oxoacyl-[acyl-carrier protein] reductase